MAALAPAGVLCVVNGELPRLAVEALYEPSAELNAVLVEEGN